MYLLELIKMKHFKKSIYHVLVIIERDYKYTRLKALKNITTATIIKGIQKTWFKIVGMPKDILTNQKKNNLFQSSSNNTYEKIILSTKLTTPYNSTGNS